ncbi:MAG: transferrin-binding protein-like solute binding protein, partial [Alphaproteobacteria bacterium]|nr:transferrin-binding protein-like solute binding protein [Alphaproteobacteria bacterium]
MKIFKFRLSIILLFAIALSGCNLLSDATDVVLGEDTPRGGVGTVYYGSNDTGDEVSSQINTRRTNQALHQETLIAKDSEGDFYNSLTEAAIDTNDQLDERVFMLQGLVVQRQGLVSVTPGGDFGWNNDSSTENDIVRVTSPSVLLSFDKNGNISGVTAYFANSAYQATNISATALTLNGTIQGVADESIFKGDGNSNTIVNTSQTAEITVNRNDSFFGFDSNYMAYIGWNVVQERGSRTAYNVTGSMIAGIETEFIPTNNTAYTLPDEGSAIRFTGKGRGIYGDFNGSYETQFNIRADIDFASNLIDISSANTVRCASGANNINCVAVSAANHLNFSASLGEISYTGNNIFGVVGAGDFLGFIDARFYGLSAREFGGTFILKGRGVEYYYGAFGAQREGVVLSSVFDSAIGVDNIESAEQQNENIAVNADGDAYSSFARAIGDTGNTADKTFTLKALSVYKDDRDIYTRPPNREGWESSDKKRVVSIANINGSAAALSFNNDGNIAAVTAYLMGETYIADDTTPTSSSELSTNVNQGAAGAIADIYVSRDDFGFASGLSSNYMAVITWNLAREATFDSATDLVDNSYTVHGNMIVGIESKTIPTNSKVDFIGKGFGTYGDLTENYKTVFDVKATIDFGDNTVMIASSKTCKNVANADCMDADTEKDISLGADRLDSLDFTTGDIAITYTGNTISSNITAGGLSGTLDARFYGLHARELGGVFSLTDANNYYYGGFGGERGFIVAPITFSSEILQEMVAEDDRKKQSIPNDGNNVPYASITETLADSNNVTNKDFTLKALSVYKNDVTEYTRTASRGWDTADSERAVKITELSDSAISLNFNSTGEISSVSAYLAGETTYTSNLIDGQPTSNIFSANSITGAANDAGNTSIDVNRSGDFFGFKENVKESISNPEAEVTYVDANYMTYVSWNVAKTYDNLATDNNVTNDTVFDISGEMIAGIETSGANIPRSGTTVRFVGKGHGTYGDVNADITYLTTFDMEANVTFSLYSLGLTTANSVVCLQTNCNANDDINIQGSLSYEKIAGNISDNNISGDIFASGGTLTGTANARFYGGAARELGGTFALANENYYYYGVFGGDRIDGIKSNFIFDDNIADDTVTLTQTIINNANANPYTSFAEITDDTVTLKALSLYVNNDFTRTRAPNRAWNTADSSNSADLNRVIGSAASLTFNNAGEISAVTTYLNNSDGNLVPYIANGFTPSSGSKTNTVAITQGAGDATNTEIKVDRSSDIFGFGNGLNYTIYISWLIEKEEGEGVNTSTALMAEDYTIDGIMIAGMEATATFIDGFAGKVGNQDITFRGAGQGIYGAQTSSDNTSRTIFDVTVDTNFSSKSLDIKGDNTHICIGEGNDACIEASDLDFMALGLTFTNNNTISDNISVGDLEGMVDARFYGDAGLQEFGGAFAVKDDEYYYYGAFGAHRDNVAVGAVGVSLTYDEKIDKVAVANPTSEYIPYNPDVGNGQTVRYGSITHTI